MNNIYLLNKQSLFKIAAHLKFFSAATALRVDLQNLLQRGNIRQGIFDILKFYLGHRRSLKFSTFFSLKDFPQLKNIY